MPLSSAFPTSVRTVGVVSGYFSPLHIGHLHMIQETRALIGPEGRLVVVVNNDAQQVLKKGRVVIPAPERVEIVAALRGVDEVFLSVDEDSFVMRSLETLAAKYGGRHMVFCNGGDRSTPEAVTEWDVCQELGIELRLGVGGAAKEDSSTRILAEMEKVASTYE